MKRKEYPLSRKSNIVIQDLEEEVLIYDLNANKALALNPTAAMVWRMCDGSRSTADISREIGGKLKSPMSEDMVWLAIKQFRDDNLLEENSEPFVTPFDGMSRRQAVKRIGFASMVALPVISSIVAPRAAWAQSIGGCAPIGNCTSGSTSTCTCTPPVQPGGNNNPDGCRCLTNGDCQGNCNCGAPCTPGPCGPGEICQSGICFLGQTSTGVLCNGSCPQGTTCNPDGSCAGVCPTSPFNFCVGAGTSTPICIPNNGGNLSANCCPCSIDGDCQGDCSNNNQGPPGVCVPSF